jgi:D-ribose pyranose/furanose isomerase RbsD
MQLLHSILGDSIKMRDMKLPDAETVPFPTDLTYQMAVQQAVVKREQEFQALSKELVAKGLMTAEEVQSVWPTLQVKVVDMRETKTPPLPEIKLPPGLNKVVVISAGE